MTVAELIERLKGMDPESTVLIDGYEGGCSEVSEVVSTKFIRDVHKSCEWYGDHQEDSESGEPGVYIR